MKDSDALLKTLATSVDVYEKKPKLWPFKDQPT
jgi:hypothetical protein